MEGRELRMSEFNPLLKIRFDGDAVEPGEIQVSHLVVFLTGMNKALQRTARLLQGDSKSVRPGPLPSRIREAVKLSLVSLTHGSPSAVLGLDRTQKSRSSSDAMFSMEILEKTISDLELVQKNHTGKALPTRGDLGVLRAWRDAGKLFSQGIARIELTLNHRERVVKALFTPKGLARIRERIKEPRTETELIRYSMAPIGINVKNHEIDRVRDRRSDAPHRLERETLVSQSFWESPSLEDLAHSQNVQPVADIRALFGTWPDEEDDGFEAAIDELRHPG